MKRTPEEIINDMRIIVKPCIMNYFKRLNYENLGSEDAEEFEEEFDAVLNLAEEAIKMRSCTALRIDNIDEDKLEALIKTMNDSPLEIMNGTSEINTGKKECKVNLTLNPFEAGVVMGTLIFAMGKKPENEPVINPILKRLKAECMKYYEG